MCLSCACVVWLYFESRYVPYGLMNGELDEKNIQYHFPSWHRQSSVESTGFVLNISVCLRFCRILFFVLSYLLCFYLFQFLPMQELLRSLSKVRASNALILWIGCLIFMVQHHLKSFPPIFPKIFMNLFASCPLKIWMLSYCAIGFLRYNPNLRSELSHGLWIWLYSYLYIVYHINLNMLSNFPF